MPTPPGYADDDTLELPRITVGSPSAAETAEPSPVFVDSSGRRQRRVRRLGWLLVVPAVAYVVLVLSSLFGGPTLHSPFLPAPRGVDAAPGKAPVGEPGQSAPASTAPRRTTTPGAASSKAPASTASDKPTAGTGAGPAPTRPTTAATGAAPSPGSNGHGRPTAPPGQGGGKPTAKP